MDPCPCRIKNLIIGIIAILLIAGIPPMLADDSATGTQSGSISISVITFPKEAAVYLNGEYRGVTPLKIEHLSPGTYEVDIRMNGYRNETVRRTLSERSMLEIGINLESLSSLPAPAGSGSVAIDSNPGGASVLLDGTIVGTTRLDGYALVVNDVPAGNHTVTMELAGYPDYTGTVTVTKNRVVKVSADFPVVEPDLPGAPVSPGTPRTPGLPGTKTATPDRGRTVPISPAAAVAALGLIGCASAHRRS